MTQIPNILVLTAGYGEGHRQAAHAVAQELRERRNPVRVNVVDFMEMVHPMINTISRYGYKKSVKRTPKLYSIFYRQTNKIKPKSILHQLVRRLGAEKLHSYIKSTKPLAVLNTFPLSAGTISWLKEEGRIDVMSTTVITDYTVHSQWVHRHTDRYFVGADHVKDILLDKGIPEDHIETTGIPIRPSFYRRYDRGRLKQAFGLDERPTALVMGGWHGVFDAKTCEALTYLETEAQLLFVCGGDRKLFRRLLPLQMTYPDRVRVFGYVSDIPELMAVSDFIMTKAGGLTTTEALSMGLPMLLYRPIPGQEEQNAQFLIEGGAAVRAHNKMELMDQFVHLCDNRQQLTRMKKGADGLVPKNAAAAISQTLLNLIRDPK